MRIFWFCVLIVISSSSQVNSLVTPSWEDSRWCIDLNSADGVLEPIILADTITDTEYNVYAMTITGEVNQCVSGVPYSQVRNDNKLDKTYLVILKKKSCQLILIITGDKPVAEFQIFLEKESEDLSELIEKNAAEIVDRREGESDEELFDRTMRERLNFNLVPNIATTSVVDSK